MNNYSIGIDLSTGLLSGIQSEGIDTNVNWILSPNTGVVNTPYVYSYGWGVSSAATPEGKREWDGSLDKSLFKQKEIRLRQDL